MHLYSHLVIAHALLPRLKPVDRGEYEWGAVLPDIRYLAGMRRRQTHQSISTVRGWLETAPGLRDFTLGCLVHVLADERDAAGALYDRVPFRPLRRRLPRPLAAALLEAAYTARVPLEICVSGDYNPLLAQLGIPRDLVEPYAIAVNRYAAAPSYTAAAEIMSGLGFVSAERAGAAQRQPPARLKRYLDIARWLEGHPRLQRALTRPIDLAAVTGRIVRDLEMQLDLLGVETEKP
jgi:hypothetical protein